MYELSISLRVVGILAQRQSISLRLSVSMSGVKGDGREEERDDRDEMEGRGGKSHAGRATVFP